MEKKILMILVGGLLFFLMTNVHATQTDVGTDIIISAIKTENQQSKKEYFDLLVEPGQHQTLYIEVKNITSETKNIVLELANATTEDTGIVNYQKNEKKRDHSMKIAFTDMAKIEDNKFSIEGGTTETVAIDLKVPNISFDGIVLGGITAKVDSDDRNIENEKLGMGIEYTYTYSLAAMVYHNKKTLEPKISLNTVQEGQVNAHNYILANIENSTAALVKHIKINSEIYNEADQLVYTSEADNFSMAPNSNFNYGIDLQDTSFIPGKYLLNLNFSIKNGNTFNFKKEFEITKKNADYYNRSAILNQSISQKNSSKIYIIAFIVAFIFIFLITMTIIMWHKSNNSSKNKF